MRTAFLSTVLVGLAWWALSCDGVTTTPAAGHDTDVAGGLDTPGGGNGDTAVVPPDVGTGDTDSPRPDGVGDKFSPDPDTGTSEPDEGTSEPDEGTSEPDAVTPGPDSGTPGPDAVTPDPDAGTPGPDTVEPPIDVSGPDFSPDLGRDCTAPANFSFFVMSLEAIQELSGSQEGFGGNLGGLAGADAKCQVTAEKVGSCKTWRAFLSVTDDGTGNAVNAVDRIGAGPWYDINGYLLAENKAGLLQTRPDGDTDIVYTSGFQQWPFNQCLTTELGNCNHSYGDTHDTLTGSDRYGRLYSTDMKYTCNDWTSTNVIVQLPIGHTWPRRLNGTDPGEAHWIQAHTNCTQGGGPGHPPGGSTTCNGCGANINLSDSMEAGVGGDGGYGAWYCFAID